MDENLADSRAQRGIPAVEKVVQALGDCALPRPALVALVRRELAGIRRARSLPDFSAVVRLVKESAARLQLSKIQPVINGAGIIIHTNLGRAPLSPAAIEALSAVAKNYSNLEADLGSGGRGQRAQYLEHNLALLCGAEAATVVNNCAAALVLIVRHFTAQKKEVVISRGELIQIGGGFRIPDILEASGATLREVGTTNKTTVADYAKAIGPATAMILKVHRSNFFMSGFVEAATTESLAALAHAKRVPLVEDLGSGAMIATEKIAGIEHEPTPFETIKRGVDLVCFSGDKLLGGPQAGIIAGKARRIAALKREPFFRALRCDKLILTALQTTVDLNLSGAADSIPVIALMQLPNEELRARAEIIVRALNSLTNRVSIGKGKAQVGGGTLPRANIESITLDFSHDDVPGLATLLRRGTPPVIGYIAGGKYKLDLRTIFPEQDEVLIRALTTALDRAQPPSAP
ncbi:MAG: L-seryl-tRNA(Sec) selenium transferase [Verrucomicrobiota bacterium]|nr:L-seryl-tRNA(Sec) selenium transferase [Verrucomicrobiota bacterium]